MGAAMVSEGVDGRDVDGRDGGEIAARQCRYDTGFRHMTQSRFADGPRTLNSQQFLNHIGLLTNLDTACFALGPASLSLPNSGGPGLSANIEARRADPPPASDGNINAHATARRGRAGSRVESVAMASAH